MNDASRLNGCIARIAPVDDLLPAKAMAHIDTLTKPLGSLGRLEELAARLFAIQEGKAPIAADPARIVTVAADHGVAAEGVSPSPAIVTRQQVHNFMEGGGGISVLCACNGIGHQVVDAGVAGEEFPEHPILVRRKIASGTANIAEGPAMSTEECLAALALGIDLADMARADGVRCLGTGEMGIANTTPSTALFAAMLGVAPEAITGPGAGLPRTRLAHKTAVIRKALAVNSAAAASRDPLAVLTALGGLEIATLSGLILGAAANRIAVMVDGFISTAAYVMARSFAPSVRDYCFFAHASAEPGHVLIMERLGERPLVDLDFRLGEGTGAVFGMLVLRSAAAMFNNMATFTGAGVSESK
ncbi:nicotinate-nucleotide--dimethylbenzimidazole phosphoribosyltransferase [Desulfovibrio sp. OttesenSCG-928-O18]|nr:nicotinate-nucleotide--dimethylbenzimidazole phosphoribosyltransferase [Desulfovibrio sp. OttesenSCG-928-O18]